MKTETLRKSILQYAIQGKLVPQIDSEEPASELLKRIKAEKDELIQQGKIKEPKPLPQIAEGEKPFEIPDSWEWVKLGTSFSIIMGQSPIGNSVNERFSGIEFHQGKIFFTNEIIALSNKSTTAPSKIAPANSLLLCVRAPVGKVNIVNREICIGRGLCSLELLANMNVKFLFYWLSAYEMDFIVKATGTTFVSITGDIVQNHIIPLPPSEEQKRIAFRIEELMLLVDEYEKKQIELEKLEKEFPEKLKKSVLQYAIQGKLVPQIDTEESASELLKKIKAEKDALIKQGKIKEPKPLPPITEEEKPFDIPDSWDWVRLGDISNNIHYGYNASAQENGNSKLLRITDIQDNKVNWSEVPYCDVTQKEFNSYGLKNRDIMIARTGGTIGKTYIVENLKEHAVFASYLIRVIPPEILFELYLKKFFECPFYWSQLKEKSIGTGQPNVNGTALKELIVTLPPLEEQKRIVSRVEKLFKLVDLLSSGGKKR